MNRACTIDGCSFTTDSPRGSPAHAQKHKNRFEELVGRRPSDYDKVRALFNRGEWPDDVGQQAPAGEQTTLQEIELP